MAEDEFERLEIHLPYELEAGVYANAVSVWHTPYEFTLDFGVMDKLDDPDSATAVPCTIVSRVRVPVTRLFDVLRALNQNMSEYEAKWGEIQRPRRGGA